MTNGINRVLDKRHFDKFRPETYTDAWYSGSGESVGVLEDDAFNDDAAASSWSSELEEIHEEPTRNGWIDVYERNRVIDTSRELLKGGGRTVLEFGASDGYMIEEMKAAFPDNTFIATDLMREGLVKSYSRNPDILHIRCDFTDAPFAADSVDYIYSLNVLEHIEADTKTIAECFRILKPGGFCLFVVPRGADLYDYFDEMLFHQRRYDKGELRSKCESAGFHIIDNYHYAWLCYPLFWMKKKWNRFIGKRLSEEEKIKRVKSDIDQAMASPFAIGLMHFEHRMSKLVRPKFGVREFILCQKGGL